MVKGHAQKEATIVDLDGTLYNVNTLHLFIKTAIAYNAKCFNLNRVAKITYWCLARAFRLTSHTNMRYKILRASGLSNDLLDEFRGKALHHLNRDVAAILKTDHKEGHPVLLATAASDAYVYCLWDGDYIASSMQGPDMRSEYKRNAAQRWLRKHDFKIGKIITDHHDDLPLAKYARARQAEVVLVNPSYSTRRRFRRNGIDFSVL